MKINENKNEIYKDENIIVKNANSMVDLYPRTNRKSLIYFNSLITHKLMLRFYIKGKNLQKTAHAYKYKITLKKNENEKLNKS